MRVIRTAFRPLAVFIINNTGVMDADRHKVDLDEAEEEDQCLFSTGRGLVHGLLTSPTLNHELVLGAGMVDVLSDEASPFSRDDHSVQLIDRIIRAMCDLHGSDIFVGKPLLTSLHWEKLLAQMPQAQFIVVYRDPCKALASIYSLGRAQFHLCYSAETIGRLIKVLYPAFYRNVIELRKTRADDEKFAIIRFDDWVKDSDRELARVVSKLKLPIVNANALPKDEGHMHATDALAIESKKWAEDAVRSDWDTTWKSIYEELGYPPPV